MSLVRNSLLRLLTLEEAQDLGARAVRDPESVTLDDLLAVAQHVSMLEADPHEALGQLRESYLVLAHRLAAVTTERDTLRLDAAFRRYEQFLDSKDEWDGADTVVIRRQRGQAS